jgi:tetratricopeptide (TPR) repeat protein
VASLNQKTVRFIVLGCLLLEVFSCKPQEERLYSKGQALQAEGKYQEALKSYEKIITLDPSSPLARTAYLQMGNVYFYGLRDYKSALGIFKDFAERGKVGPEVFEARKNLAEILYRYLRNYREAIIEYQRLAQDFPEHDEILSFQEAIANCYFELNNFNQSRVEFREILKKNPDWAHQDRA